jgi:hypothetical protein
MKINIVRKMVLGALAAALLSAAAFAQTPKRIDFAKEGRTHGGKQHEVLCFLC